MALEHRRPVRFATMEAYRAGTPEGHWELVEGVLYRFGHPATPEMLAAAWKGVYVGDFPTPNHQVVAGRIFQAFANYLDDHPIGQAFASSIGVTLGSDLLLGPDVTLLLDGGAATLTELGVEGPPDLVVEAVSPSSVRYDARTKRGYYEAAGVREFWLAWPTGVKRRGGRPDPCLEVFRRDGAGALTLVATLGIDDVLTTPLLPGFQVAVARLFRGRA